MLEKENSIDIPRLRKRKIMSYAEAGMSLDMSGSSGKEIRQKKVAKKNEDSGYAKSSDESLINNELENELTEYELIRLRNIEERKRLLCELNIEEVMKDFKAVTNVEKGRKSFSRKKTPLPPPPPRPKSLRLQNKSPSGEPLPEKKEPMESVIMSAVDVAVARKPSGPLEMTVIIKNKVDNDDIKKYMKYFESDVKKEASCTPEKKLDSDLEHLKEKLSKMTISADHVIKVVPHRIYSMAIHPCESNILVAVGSKWGHLGLWNIQAKETESIQVFEPHSGPVNCTNFCVYNPAKIYSTSHDGTVRCGDMNRFVFDEIYSSDEDMAKNHTTWHCQTEECCLLVAHGNGNIALVDSRTASRTEGWYTCHERSVRTVQLHPLENQYFMTSSALCEVKMWDRRFINNKRAVPVHTLTHPKGLTSAFFSPSGKFVLTTCNDDRLRVFDVRDMKSTRPNVVANVTHNTHTGRWLSPFKATWHPQRDDVFIVGSMEHPRGILLYSSKGERVYKLMDENLASVCSVCLFHPTQDIIVGGNSSGRVHVFM